MSPSLLLRLLGRAVAAWWNDNLIRLGASVAYYTLFAVAPILLVVVAVAGAVFGDEAVRGEIAAQIDGLIGTAGASAVEALIEGARRPDGSAVAVVVGTLTTMLAAAGVFLELQFALNTIWRASPSEAGMVRQFLWNRAQSFGVVLSIGFLLLVSLAVSAGLAGLAAWLGGRLPGVPVLLQIANWLLSIASTAALFGLLFKVLPDVSLGYRDVAVGGVITALLFTAGQHVIGLYLGRSSVASSYGAVGSVAALLLWVYYSAQIILIGAQFTRLYTEHRRVVAAPTLTRV
jgi:membrane protein